MPGTSRTEKRASLRRPDDVPLLRSNSCDRFLDRALRLVVRARRRRRTSARASLVDAIWFRPSVLSASRTASSASSRASVRLPFARTKLGLDRPEDQLSALIVARRVRSRHGRPVLGLVEASLPVHASLRASPPCPASASAIVRALEVLALLAQRRFSGMKIASQELDVGSHGSTEDDDCRRARRAR